MKRTYFLFAAAMAASVMLSGCGEEKDISTIDASKYVTLGEYKGLSVSINDTTVTDEEVEEAVSGNLAAKGVMTAVTDRAVETGDTVNIDYEGKKDGVAFDGGTAAGYDLEIGSGTFIDGFEDGLIGHKTGEKVALNLTFPENYSSEELAGQDVVFDVTINSISENVVPELTDEVAKELDAEVSTKEEYIEKVRTDLEESKQTSARTAVYSELLELAQKNSEVVSGDKLPSSIVDSIAEQEKTTFESNLTAYGMTLESYLTNFGMTEEDFNNEIRTYSESYAQQELLVHAIAKAEGIEITDEVLQNAYKEYAERYGYASADEFISALKEHKSEETFKEATLTEEVEKFLFENANIENPEMVTWTED
ncbi:MAG: trigger factor [Lachnospiraceae bacterium]|nr:trigger factor [Lachnospiraceae bacterium]MDN4741962.1 trigger factor [Lachnospiraceae bacterium C1.1]